MRTYKVYRELVFNSKCNGELRNIHHWEGPLVRDCIRSVLLYDVTSTEKYIDILKKYNVKIYRRVSSGPCNVKYVQAEY